MSDSDYESPKKGGGDTNKASSRNGVWEDLKGRLPGLERDNQQHRDQRMKLFRDFDPNGNGFLSLAEVDAGCRKELQLDQITDDLAPILMRAFTAAKDVRKAKGANKKHGDDYVERAEFRLLMVYIYQYFELWFMFDEIDSGDDRRVNKDEFKEALPKLESWGVPEGDAETQFQEIDVNGGGIILFKEFADWALKRKLDADGGGSDSDLDLPEDEKKEDETATQQEKEKDAAAEDDQHYSDEDQNDDDHYDDDHEEESPKRQEEERQKEQSPSKARSGRGGGNTHAYPPVATVSYPSREKNLQVTDFLDPSRPLVKSTLPLTKPLGPTFVEEDKIVQRLRRRSDHKQVKAAESTRITKQRSNERRYLKAQYEFEREKQLAERAIYHRERCSQWSQRLGASPLAVDLVADNERIEEEAYIRELEEKRRKNMAEKKKRRVKNQIIVKALAEVPLLEEARRQKREILDEERRERALRDVQRVEVIQMRKARDQTLMEKERQERLDQRIMNHTSAKH